MKCRHCGADLSLPLIDLGSAPPSNAYLAPESLHAPEQWFPLRVLVCENCWLAQTEDFAQAQELFNAEYAYFSSFSKSWLAHAERYVADMVARFHLTTDSHVVEVAANDGYLLRYVKARGIPCTGIEPTASTAAAARALGIPIVGEFFGVDLARKLVAQGKQADLIAANNVLAHVPDINDFIAGFAALLTPGGVATFEFPHLLKLVEQRQFDTIYHEHFSYLSLTAVCRIFSANGLSVFDVQEHPTHGGSLRVFAQRSDHFSHPMSEAVARLLAVEEAVGMKAPGFYQGLQKAAERIKDDLVTFLIETRRAGNTVAGYGAAAKGNTLLNFAGVKSDLVEFICDAAPSKQGKFMPGSRIPIMAESHLRQRQPDYVLILPWNIREEVMTQLAYVRTWGGQFVTAVPSLEIR